MQVTIKYMTQILHEWCFNSKVKIEYLQRQLTCLRDALIFLLNQLAVENPATYPLFIYISKASHVNVIYNRLAVPWKFDFLLEEIHTFINRFPCYKFVKKCMILFCIKKT